MLKHNIWVLFHKHIPVVSSTMSYLLISSALIIIISNPLTISSFHNDTILSYQNSTNKEIKVLNSIHSSMASTNRSVALTNHKITSTNRRFALTNHKITSTNRPIASTNHKIVSTNRPIASTNHKITSTNRPIASTNHKITPTNRPIASTNHKITSTNRPIASTNHKITSTNRPIASINHKIASTNRRTISTKQNISLTHHRIEVPINTTLPSPTFHSLINCIHPNSPSLTPSCLGFEQDCPFIQSYSQSTIRCSDRSNDHSLQSITDQITRFWYQADFGYLKRKLNRFPDPDKCQDSMRYLRCSDDETFCEGQEVVLTKSNKPKTGFIVAKRCMRKSTVNENRGFFASWSDAVVYPGDNENSTLTVCDRNHTNKTIMVVKVDPAINLYHHVTNFINLYITQLLIDYLQLGEVDIVILWTRFREEFTPPVAYRMLWESYAPKIYWSQTKFFGEFGNRVCLGRVILAHPPRARRGMYFRMPLVFGCERSALFDTFRTNLLGILNVKLILQTSPPRRDRIRVGLIQRRRLNQRHIINIEQLQGVLVTFRGIQLELIDSFDETTSLETQMNLFANIDILIGVHGAGLTHLLWLPLWASVVEIWHCGDPAVFFDLARLRGVDYRAGEYEEMVKPENGTELRPKYQNYWVDVEQLMAVVLQSIRHVVEHPVYLHNAL